MTRIQITKNLRCAEFALLCLTAPAAFAQTPAFPGAEGFGRFTSGGRGGEVYIVTNLNDSGSGSLREAVINRTPGVARTVVFAVSGTIYLNSTLRITQGNLTIAGQTAPGDGICLAYYPIDPSNSTNVVIRFLRARLGDVSGKENDAFSCRYATNVIVDHCSFSWSVDETASSYDNTNFTMQWCIVSESMRDSVHSKGPHGYGAIWGGLGATFHHNLIAHHDSRNPRFNGARTHGTANELVDMRDNVIYNWRGNSTYGGEPTDTGLPARQNMINNTYKPGPATSTTSAVRYRILEPTENTLSTGATFSQFHISGNHTTASATVTADNWNGGVQAVSSSLFPSIRSDTAFVVAPVITQTAQGSFPLVLDYSGCRLPARDSVDTRVVSEARNGTFTYRGSKGNSAGIIDSQADVGGWPTLVSTPAPPDADSDGMPDAWESTHGLNPANPADRNLTNAEGFTNLELYLNNLATPAFPIPQLSTQPVSQTVTAGTGFSLSVTATGPGPLAYQWYHGTDPISGATAASYSVATTTGADSGNYTAVVSNDYGSASSAAAAIVVESLPPSITSEPASQELLVGQTATFSVSTSGTQPITLQWYRGGNPIQGATSATLDLGPATLATAGHYHVVATNAHGSDTSATASISVTSIAETGVFSTGFNTDTIHAASPVVSPTATNWYVMSSKNATTSSIGDDPATSGSVDPRLDLTIPSTSSGVVETAALFSTSPVAVPETGNHLRLQVVLTTNNIRALGIGLYRSGGTPPYTGLINSQLSSGSSTFATGGTRGWKGYRFHLDATAPAISVEGRPVQPGTNNASQSLIIPSTSSSAPTINPIGSVPLPGFTWTDSSTYTLTLDLERSAVDAFKISTTVHAGTNTAATALGTSTAITTSAATLPSAVAESFDALAIGYRNRDSSTISHLRVLQVSVKKIETLFTVSDPYQAFLATHGLDPAGTGLPDADPEADGIANSLEFVLGGDPKKPDTSILPTLTAAAPGWTFHFLQHVDTSMVFTPMIERSSQLLGWTTLTNGTDGVTITRTPFNATHEQIDVHVPDSSAPALFLRLAIAPKQTP